MHRLTSYFRLAALFLSVTIGAATSYAADTPLRVAVINQSDALALYVAADHGMFVKRGLKVELIPVANQGVIVSSLVSQSADIAFSVAPVIVQAKENGIELQIVAGAAQFPTPKPAYAGILARTGSGIKTADDLIGKTVGVVSLNSFHHIMARRWLAESKVNPDKVTFVEVGLPQMQDLMKSSKIDAGVTVDPFYNRMIEQQIGYNFVDYLATVPAGVPVDFYMATPAWIAAHRDATIKFGEAIADAVDFIKTHPTEARDSLGKYTKLPPNLLASTGIPNLTATIDPASMQWWASLLKSQGLISSEIKTEELVFKR